MKYIRTKYNTIAEVSHLGIEGLLKDRLGKYEEFSTFTNKYGIAYFYADDIVREADTIEELCDCFVKFRHEVYDIDLIRIGFRYAFVGIYKRFSKARKGLRYRDNSEILYGAVWTDKGLIYVAKFNKEGEFELL